MLRWVPRPFSVGLSVVVCAVVLSGLNLLAVPVVADDKPEKEPPKTVTVDLGDGVKMEFVLIPKGKFKMGSPKTEDERSDDELQHEVEISKPFYLAKYPVTQKQYDAIVKEKPSYFQAGNVGADKVKGLDTDQFAVEKVSWDDAQTFCKKMKDKDKQSRKFRLPSEAEWEYACRAGTTTPFNFGSKLNGKEANCDGNYPYGTTNKGSYKERTTKVGEYGANKWGLCDMHGNVWQWCEDYYGPYNDDLKSTDPLRSIKYSEERRVLRGGSWFSNASNCRAAYRLGDAPGSRDYNCGFRVAFRLD
jgi:formylglycine-generating enzyme required for sulfatase activity